MITGGSDGEVFSLVLKPMSCHVLPFVAKFATHVCSQILLVFIVGIACWQLGGGAQRNHQ